MIPLANVNYKRNPRDNSTLLLCGNHTGHTVFGPHLGIRVYHQSNLPNSSRDWVQRSFTWGWVKTCYYHMTGGRHVNESTITGYLE